MSLSDNYQPDVSIGNGVTLVYTGSWKVFNSAYFVAQLQEIATGAITNLTLGADYNLTFNEAGYEMTLLIAAPDSDYYIIRSRNVELSQTNPYRTSKGFQGRVIEDSFDKLTAIDQDQQDQIDRAMKFQVGSQFAGIIIEDPIDGRSLKWDVPNNKIVNSDNDPDQVVADSQQYLAQTEAARDVALGAQAGATTQAGIALGHAQTAESWAIDPIGDRPEGSAKYWAQQAASFSPPNNNWTATADPTVNDDAGDAWTVGSQWYNSVSGEIFVCANNTIGAAVWIKTTLTIDELTPLLDLKEDKITTAVGTSINYTLQLSDASKLIEVNSASNRTVTVPPNSSVAFPVGTKISLYRRNTGTVTVVAGSGVTVQTPETLVLRKQWSMATLWKRGTDEWILTGDLVLA